MIAPAVLANEQTLICKSLNHVWVDPEKTTEWQDQVIFRVVRDGDLATLGKPFFKHEPRFVISRLSDSSWMGHGLGSHNLSVEYNVLDNEIGIASYVPGSHYQVIIGKCKPY